LVDKGYLGTSGVMATAGVGHWWVPPDPGLRAAAIDSRYERSEGLADKTWMARVLELTWETVPSLKGLYAFPSDEEGGILRYRTLRGPEYGRALRRLVKRSGVQVYDHAPALELLVDSGGTVAGVAGWLRQSQQAWRIRCGAVVLATGGTAFKSFLLGSHVDTGDGALMAAEAGAELSGMEFSGYYTPSPLHSTMTRSMSYLFGTYTDADQNQISVESTSELVPTIAKALLRGPVFAVLDRMPEDIRDTLTRIQPNLMLGFDRQGIDPFRDRFEVTLRSEGTIRGTGGLRIAGDDCRTTVPGLFAAGDVATRELVAGATSGGGAQNSAWALSSGIWAGQAAVTCAQAAGARRDHTVRPLGRAGLRPDRGGAAPDLAEIMASVQSEMLPYDKNLFREGPTLQRSLAVLDEAWASVRQASPETGIDRVEARETAAMVAMARWCYRSALAREESRGLHRRLDRPERRDELTHRLLVGGLDKVWTRPERAATPTAVGAR
jgi:succinate dehydrogenase/fumarate reductase flavoprotein subunit